MSEELTLIHYLRKIQIDWQLDLPALARIAHLDLNILTEHLAKSESELLALPTIPAGFESSVPLISIYKNLKTLRPSLDSQHEWLENKNEILEGNRPIEVMAMSPAHLAWVSYTLESAASAAP